jgi:signal transduction histidine kinase
MTFARLATFRRIGWQLPLTIAALLLAVVGLFSWAAYREVRHAVLAAAEDRLAHAGRQLAALMAQANQMRLAETRRLAADPAVVEAVAGGNSLPARRALDRFTDSVTAPVTLELFDAAGNRVIDTRSGRADSLPVLEPAYPAWSSDSTAVSGLRAMGDTIWYDVAAPVESRGGRGVLVQRRWVTANPAAARLLGDLLGSDSAAILLGTPGGVWTDFARVVLGPPVHAEAGLNQYDRDGRRVGLGHSVPGTNWMVWVELPAGAALARADAFLGRVAPAGLLIVLIGAGAGWLISRRVARPLAQLRGAAAGMAAGDLEQQVDVKGPDELRQLAEAFNTMARRVGVTHQELERQVAERTAALWRHATDLEAANRELEAFSYSVSHDLRAPLRAIHGFSQAVLEDASDRLGPETTGYLERVRAAADRMALLIDDLLELSRVSRAEIRTEPVDLSDLATRVTAELRHGHPDREVEVRIAPGLRATGDHRLLRLALQNLIDNAWKFTAKRDDASIEVGGRNGADPAFYVRDNGAGFDMTYANKLFGVFQRLHTANEFPGTGVGLAIVQRIVHRHGGRIWGEGAPDRGATFYFTLPGSGGEPATGGSSG